MGRRSSSVLLGATVALAFAAATSAAKPSAFNCAKAVSAKDATAIFGTSTKLLAGAGPTQCRVAPKGRTIVSLGVAAVPPARYQDYVTLYKTGTTPHGTGGARDEIVSKAVSISGAKAIQAEDRRFHNAPSTTPDILRYVIVYKKGRLLTMTAGPELGGPVPALKQLVLLARKYAAKL